VPYLLIAAGAGYTKKKEEFINNDTDVRDTPTKKNVLDDSLINNDS